MLTVEKLMFGQPFADLRQDIGKQIIVQMECNLPLLLTSTDDTQQHVFGFHLHLVGGLPPKRTDVGFLGEVERNLCFVRDRFHINASDLQVLRFRNEALATSNETYKCSSLSEL